LDVHRFESETRRGKRKLLLSLLLLAVLVAVALSAFPGAALATPVSAANGYFVGLDEAGAKWRVAFMATGRVDADGFPVSGAAGVVMVTSCQSLSRIAWPPKGFVLNIECYAGVDHFSTWDAGAAAAMGGHVIASTGGEGVPARGDFCYFSVFDGKGDVVPGGTEILQDRWKYWTGTGSPMEMRNFQRNLLYAFSLLGSTFWPVSTGNIQVRGGMVF
jgi:hypothetical protein